MKKMMGKLAGLGLAALTVAAPLTVSAANYWTINGSGTWDASTLWSPDAANSSQTAAATTNADDVYFSANGITAGTVTVSGNQVANRLYLNQAFNFTGGTIDLSSGASGTLSIGASGTISSILKTKGILFTQDNLTLTLKGGNNSSLTQNNNQPITGATLSNRQTSTLILSEGAYQGSYPHFNLGNVTAGTGGVVVVASATYNGGLTFHIGSNADGGLFRVEGGYVTTSANMSISRGKSSVGRLIVSSGTVFSSGATNDFLVGFESGKGTMDVTGGLVNIQGKLTLNVQRGNNNADSYGIVNISGSGVVTTKGIQFGNGDNNWGNTLSGTSLLNVTGGRLNIGASGIVNSGSGTSIYAINLSGGTVASSAAWSSTLNMTLSKTATTSGVTFDTTSGNIELGGIISGGGNFAKAGTGTLLLSGANNYNGDAVISAGTLEIGASGALTLGELTFVLDGASNGLLDIKTGAAVTLSGLVFNTSAATLADGKTWNLIDGAFTAANGFYITGFTNSGGIWKDDATQQFSFDQSSGILSYTATIPEPSALALMFTGGALLLFLRRKR